MTGASGLVGIEGDVSDNGPATEHFDIVIVGAGISGIGAAYHLQQSLPGKRFVILENLESFGGTWHVHRYPGIRSDSDLYTFGYRFKPWTGPPIATAGEILSYLGEVIEENGISYHIRYRHRVLDASWSSEDKSWTLRVLRLETGETVSISAGFLWMCQGYYRHGTGYTPDWPGLVDYQGTVVHPQTWPEDLDYAGKDVVVIGSGATAATLVPAIAEECDHVTILQRSPTYFFSGPNRNETADMLRELDIPEEWVHEITRRKILHEQHAITQLSFDDPDFLAGELINSVRAQLPDDFDVERHFTPRYRPWRQRLAYLPDGDLFKAISSGKASIVTDVIEEFTEKGIRLASGDELTADIVVTATGFNLSVLGDINFIVDGAEVDFANSVTYRGMMFTGVPNMVWVFGYFRASWTLRVDLVADFVCRLLAHMDDLQAASVLPQLRSSDRDTDMAVLEWVDPENFNPGYLMRSAHLMPRRGDKAEWQHSQDYWSEKDVLATVDLDDGCLVFE